MSSRKKAIHALAIGAIFLTGCATGPTGDLTNQRATANAIAVENDVFQKTTEIAPANAVGERREDGDLSTWRGKVVFCSEY